MLPSSPMLISDSCSYSGPSSSATVCSTHLLALAASPTEPLNIVVTIPVLKDLAEQVGGSHVRVTSLLSGYENEHTYSPKPSDLVAVRKARLLFEIGIGLEVWVSSLVKNAGSASLRVVTTSKGIALLRDGQTSRRGSCRRRRRIRGNPHVWLDPENAMTMMRHITEALIQLDPAHATEYRTNQASYLRKLDQLRGELSDRVTRVADRRFIAHHPAWPYFARRFGFQIVGTIQPQSGSEPSALHLHELISEDQKRPDQSRGLGNSAEPKDSRTVGQGDRRTRGGAHHSPGRPPAHRNLSRHAPL